MQIPNAHSASRGPSTDGPRALSLRGRGLVVTDDKPTFWDKAAAGAWEPELLDALERTVRPGDVMLDIGAWVGPTGLFAALLGASVVCVEADPRAVELLRGNIAANAALARRMQVIARAASPHQGPLRLGAPRKPGDSMSSALHADLANAWEVETVQPDSLIATALSAGKGSLVIKIDIEGGEYELLPALAPLLPRDRTRALIAAFHPSLLREAGRSAAALQEATRQCVRALQGWDARVLDVQSDAPPEKVAATGNCTILFTPQS